MTKTLVLALAASVFTTTVATAEKVEVDPKLPDYAKTSGVGGNLNSIGSDTLNNLMALWAESFKGVYPNVNIQIEGKGSATAPPALIEATAQLGPMSREMKGDEIDRFEKKFGYKPTEIRVAVDSLAVFVHKDNPIVGLSLQQVDSIFSSTLKAGGKSVAKWGELGLTGVWASRPISLYGRNSASGTYGFFKEHALQKGDFKPTVKEQPGSSSVVQGIGSDLAGVGYSGIGYKTSGVRVVPLSAKPDGKSVEPTYANCLSGDYPMARFLLVYVNKKPGQPLDALTSEFLKFVVSKEGQQVVVKDGYFPLPPEIADEEIKKLAK
ncbi:MAG: phosphate ABC transporter substrate-binding protein [Chthoniobacteraceae bacterium]